MSGSDNRLIRVFLSSTFVDFQEERSLLVQQVFPSLRRRARSRGVEIVDVDLRWGVTAEMTERGETLPLCLGEIDRCRPYFISLLGERYGWVPPPNYYKPELLERQPWLKERMGGASVTELEILHGVLRNPDMAGHALFYLRDPAYAEAQPEPGWVAENPTERQRLAALKSQIRASGFPVADGLANPQAIAERIEADLWQLIESRFPEQQPADALEREGRRHSDYRRARTGLYLGGEPAIETLESWITQGEQRILITGDSGAGKSALIANWLEAHQRNQPQDLVHAHHLGCTNDASAVRPLLGRLIDTASQLLVAEQQISEPLKVPQDWWELVFKVGEVFALLSPWCERQGRRWILVLDGLDRLAEEDQQALPWIPTAIPPCIHVVASALDCPARTILQERQYRTHEIGPLGNAEQQHLIERYLSRYTKQLESGLQQKILAHKLAGSPLFLKVLLEELRQCAWYDTLQEQVAFYLSAQSIDGLYAKVLERLENNGHGEATRKALTALWASRAGLSEEELLAITGLAPLQWAPIDLALEQAFGRNGEQLVFDHEFLRKAVEVTYAVSEEQLCKSHWVLADWFLVAEEGDPRKSEELIWQLAKAGRQKEIPAVLSSPIFLDAHVSQRGFRETRIALEWAGLDELLGEDTPIQIAIEAATANSSFSISQKARLLMNISRLIEELGLFGVILLRVCNLVSRILMDGVEGETPLKAENLFRIAQCQRSLGNYSEAASIYRECIEISIADGGESSCTALDAMHALALLYQSAGESEKAIATIQGLISTCKPTYGERHPRTISACSDLALFYSVDGKLEEASKIYEATIPMQREISGPSSIKTLLGINSLACLVAAQENPRHALLLFAEAHAGLKSILGTSHPDTLTALNNVAVMNGEIGNHDIEVELHEECLRLRLQVYGVHHVDTIDSIDALGSTCIKLGKQSRKEELVNMLQKAMETAPMNMIAAIQQLINALGNERG